MCTPAVFTTNHIEGLNASHIIKINRIFTRIVHLKKIYMQVHNLADHNARFLNQSQYSISKHLCLLFAI